MVGNHIYITQNSIQAYSMCFRNTYIIKEHKKNLIVQFKWIYYKDNYQIKW